MSHIGEAIHRTRQVHEMSIRKLAREADLSTTFVMDIESGARLPSHETVLKIGNVFVEEDTTAWLWLLLTDLWGQPIANVMREGAAALAASSEQPADGEDRP
jgi:transcriptional regulator with XRE-family HTH domain